MKKFASPLLLALGCIPFPAGFWMDRWMTAHPDQLFPYLPAGLVFLLVFFLVGFLGYRLTESTGKALLFLTLPGLLDLILLFIQEILLGRYWPGLPGAATQMFYLPILNLGSRLDVLGHSLFSACLLSFFLTAAAACLGAEICRKTDK